MDKQPASNPHEPVENKPNSAAKRPYTPPRLTRLGDLHDVTLGPSAGIGESGNPVVFRA